MFGLASADATAGTSTPTVTAASSPSTTRRTAPRRDATSLPLISFPPRTGSFDYSKKHLFYRTKLSLGRPAPLCRGRSQDLGDRAVRVDGAADHLEALRFREAVHQRQPIAERDRVDGQPVETTSFGSEFISCAIGLSEPDQPLNMSS